MNSLSGYSIAKSESSNFSPFSSRTNNSRCSTKCDFGPILNKVYISN